MCPVGLDVGVETAAGGEEVGEDGEIGEGGVALEGIGEAAAEGEEGACGDGVLEFAAWRGERG